MSNEAASVSPRCFNEARAFSAGNPRRSSRPPAPTSSFNEARAFSAGNRGTMGANIDARCSFNEARAFSAGNRVTHAVR